MTDFELPAAMVEAGARRWWEILTVAPRTPWEERDEQDRQHDRDQVTLILAAALSVCEVRERWRVTGHSLGEHRGEGWRQDADSLPDALNVAQHYRVDHDARGVEIGRLLIVFTPAEQVDTEES